MGRRARTVRYLHGPARPARRGRAARAPARTATLPRVRRAKWIHGSADGARGFASTRATGSRPKRSSFSARSIPRRSGLALRDATHYEATPVSDLAGLLAAVPLPLEGTSFVDLGSGMGRVVLLATAYPFRQIIGVEISPALHEVARENLAPSPAGAAAATYGSSAPMRCAFAFPRGDLVVYLFNPFRGRCSKR